MRDPRAHAHASAARALPDVQTAPPVLADERLDAGRGVDVRERPTIELATPSCDQLAPRHGELIGLGHVCHRAAGGKIREDHLLVRRRENVGALSHEVHAAEHDVVGVGVLRRSDVTASTNRRCSRRNG